MKPDWVFSSASCSEYMDTADRVYDYVRVSQAPSFKTL